MKKEHSPVSFRCPLEMAIEARIQAARLNQSRSKFIRDAVTKYLEDIKKETRNETNSTS